MFKKYILITGLMLSSSAQAGLYGDSIDFEWRADSSGYLQTYTYVVTPEIEHPVRYVTGELLSYIDISDDYIEISKQSGIGYSAGISWTFSNLDFGTIADIVVTSNFVYWDPSSVTFTADSVNIFLKQETGFEPHWAFLRVTLIPAVPEPSSYALLGLGLGLLSVAARRVKRDAV